MKTWLRVFLIALSGCAVSAGYVYVPQHATAWFNGYPAESHALAAGRVELTSFGVLAVGGSEMLHVRVVLNNERDEAWTIVPSEQQVEFPGAVRAAPAGAAAVPITVEKHGRRDLDLYYALPGNIEDDEDLPSFDVLWQITTPAGPFAARTRFRRSEQSPNFLTPRATHAPGFGPYRAW